MCRLHSLEAAVEADSTVMPAYPIPNYAPHQHCMHTYALTPTLRVLLTQVSVCCCAPAACCYTLLPAGQQNKSPFYTQPWNIKGDVLILDVGSLSFQGNHPAFPPFGEEGCVDACARTPGCNAWTYCSSKEGCGSCCKAYIAQNPQCRHRHHLNQAPCTCNCTCNVVGTSSSGAPAAAAAAG
jgi:hypothetical protein